MSEKGTDEQSEFWAEYWSDFLAAQKELKNVGFDSKNPHFKNEYASLAACLDAIRPVFNRHNLVFFQELWAGEKGPRVATWLAHKSGEFRQFGVIEMPASKQDAQGWAGAITYARRYALLAMAGVTGDYDDDGEAAVAEPATKPTTKKGN